MRSRAAPGSESAAGFEVRRLRAWVADNDQWVAIQSELALAVNRALRERDVEIPFPQRDLHLRSIAPELRQPIPSADAE